MPRMWTGQKLGQGADLSTSPLISTLEAARKGSLTPRDAAESAQSCWEMPQQTSLWSDAIRLLPNLTLNSRRWWRMRTLSKILYLFYSEKALIKGLQITWMPSNHSRNILFCYLAFSEEPPTTVPRRWHIQGQRDKEIQQREKNLTMLTLSCVVQTNLLKMSNPMNCHRMNKLQNKTPTTELVTNT